METKLEYLFDSGTTLNMLEIQKFKKKELVKWGFSFKNTLVNIEPTQHCCLGNDIFSVCLINQNLRNCPSSFFVHDFSGITGNFEQKKNCKDHQKANTVQLFFAIEEHFSGVFRKVIP